MATLNSQYAYSPADFPSGQHPFSSLWTRSPSRTIITFVVLFYLQLSKLCVCSRVHDCHTRLREAWSLSMHIWNVNLCVGTFRYIIWLRLFTYFFFLYNNKKLDQKKKIYISDILHLRCKILFYTELLYWAKFSIARYSCFSIVQYFMVLSVGQVDTEHSPVLLNIFSTQF
jgi:hypothetical protein